MQVATLVKADWLFLLTDVDSLYTANPANHPEAVRIPEVHDITKLQVSDAYILASYPPLLPSPSSVSIFVHHATTKALLPEQYLPWMQVAHSWALVLVLSLPAISWQLSTLSVLLHQVKKHMRADL